MKKKSLRPHLPYNRTLNEKARRLRHNPTPAEKSFWNALRKMPFYPSAAFNRQKPIGGYIADFYCHRFLLAVEIDGGSHGEDKNIAYDARRTACFESLGVKVIRFSNREVRSNIDGVMAQVGETVRERKEKLFGFANKSV
ncbi:MAG: endonuclease domain-containing protein [Nitrospinae bacterium]|nr:endonuclease domain-containing protein [Nitrospinota bacterium]